MQHTTLEKLTILADSAKYDVACTSSGASRRAAPGTLGSCYAPGAAMLLPQTAGASAC